MALRRLYLPRLASAVVLLGACHGARTEGAGGLGASSAGGRGGAGGGGDVILLDGGPSGSAGDAGCGAAVDADASTGCEGVDGGVGYAAHVAPILATCTGELCHQPPSRAWLVGVATAECCDGRPRVAPGDAARSYLMNKLTGEGICSGLSMPMDQPLLPPPQIDTIRRWICEGAPDD